MFEPISLFNSFFTATVKENSRSLLNFDAYVDWHQRHEFLKCKLVSSTNNGITHSFANFFIIVELPLNIHSDYATYETQFGYVQRPTHKNTTWDIAKVGFQELVWDRAVVDHLCSV